MFKEYLQLNNFENMLARIKVDKGTIFFEEYFLYTNTKLKEKYEFNGREVLELGDNREIKEGSYVLFVHKSDYKIYPIPTDITLSEYLMDNNVLPNEMIYEYSMKRDLGILVRETKRLLRDKNLDTASIVIVLQENLDMFDYTLRDSRNVDFEGLIMEYISKVKYNWMYFNTNYTCGKLKYTIDKTGLKEHYSNLITTPKSDIRGEKK